MNTVNDPANVWSKRVLEWCLAWKEITAFRISVEPRLVMVTLSRGNWHVDRAYRVADLLPDPTWVREELEEMAAELRQRAEEQPDGPAR